MTSETEDEGAPVACANIGPRERAKRRNFAIAGFAAAALLTGSFVVLRVPAPWRLTAFLPLLAGSLGLFQVTERTCVALVARGVRDMDDGEQAVTDAQELEQLARQARRVYTRAFLLAGGLTLLVVLLP